jgi:hypothetical protein
VPVEWVIVQKCEVVPDLVLWRARYNRGVDVVHCQEGERSEAPPSRSEEDEMRRRGNKRERWRGIAYVALALVAGVVLASCSSGSGAGSKLSLGLTGSTASHPAQPPTLAANGPADAYAFVYDDQIWIHDAGASTARQLTHLVLSAGANIAWGPLEWSPNGKFIAYALNENLTPSDEARTTAPIYVVNTGDGSVVNTAATGSLYGHTYAWFDDTMLFYSSGSSILMYDVGDGDPRVWTALTAFGIGSGSGPNSAYNGNGVTYGDVALTSTYLYFTTIALNQNANLGGAGVVGTAELDRIYLNGLQKNAGYQPGDYLQFFPLTKNPGGDYVESLGNAYFDTSGNLVAGSWQISGDASTIVAQQIGNVSVKSGTVSSTIYQGSGPYNFPSTLLKSASAFPLATRALLGVDQHGAHVAFTAGTLFTQATSGRNVSKLDGVGWTTPPEWSKDGKRVAVTQFVRSSVDANGVLQMQLNIVVYDGAAGLTLVQGGQDLAWKP